MVNRLCSRRSFTVLLVLLATFLVGTVIVLSTVNAYFSIDASAYILPQELGTWNEIRWDPTQAGLDNPAAIGWAKSHPHIAKYFFPLSKSLSGAIDPASPLSNVDVDPARPAIPRPSVSQPWTEDSPKEKIPRIIHQTWKDDQLPSRWQAVRDECAAMHPDYDYMLWTDELSRKFIAEHYSWFLPVFDGYPYVIQRADVIRYFVLHYYGGIYMDLDIGCVRPLDPLLRFEVILPKTIPVGVSNDLIFAAKGHPFMDLLIHNLITFNHQYLTNYPTVMFSTGPMFVSASYGLYVESHGGAAQPSTWLSPRAGFDGVRVLPKSLYGKNAKPGEAPDAFFRHFYGSSWHSNDAGFLIFLRDHGRFMMFLGACFVAYGIFKGMLPRLLAMVSEPATRRNRRGRWISLAVRGPDLDDRRVRTSPRVERSRSRGKGGRVDAMDVFANGASSSSTSRGAAAAAAATGSQPSTMAAPRPQRFNLPLFELQEDQEDSPRDESSPGLLAWMGSNGLSRPSSRNDNLSEPGDKKKGQGVLYLPAYFVGSSPTGRRSDDASASTSTLAGGFSAGSSPTTSIGVAGGWGAHSRRASATAATNTLGNWAAKMLPAGWRTPSPLPNYTPSTMPLMGRTPSPHELESVCSSPEPSESGGHLGGTTRRTPRFNDTWITPSVSPALPLHPPPVSATPPPPSATSAYPRTSPIEAPPVLRVPKPKSRRNPSDDLTPTLFDGVDTPQAAKFPTLEEEETQALKSPALLHRSGNSIVGGSGTSFNSPPTDSRFVQRQGSNASLIDRPEDESLVGESSDAAPPPYESMR